MKRKGFTLIELLVVVAIIALLISILLPSLGRARELSKRAVCAANVRGIGQSCKVYANDFNEQWPISAALKPGAGYTRLGSVGKYILGTGAVNTPPVMGPVADPSIGQCFWLLVRGGSTTAKQFICPSSSDAPDPKANPMSYFDFGDVASASVDRGAGNLSYGYQHPYGRFAVPSEGIDPSMPVAADKGRSGVTVLGLWSGTPVPPTLLENWTPDNWKGANSSAHSEGEGQNVLFMDGHASFEKKSACGTPRDPNDPTVSYRVGSHANKVYGDIIYENNRLTPIYSSANTNYPGGCEPNDANDSVIAHSAPI